MVRYSRFAIRIVAITWAVLGPSAVTHAQSVPSVCPTLCQTQSANFGTRSIGQVELSLSATGGNGIYAWSVVAGALPPGLAIRTDLPSFFPGTASAGLIGVATTPGSYNFTLRVTSNGEDTDQPSTLKITALTVLDQFTLPDAFVSTPYSYTFTALGNAGALTWTPTGGVPSGMTFSAGGVLSGTPTAPLNNFNIPFTVSDGTDSVGRSVNLTVSAISVSAVGVLAPGVLPNATQNVAYSATLTATGGAGGYTYTANGLPSGLTLNGATGVISGTPSSFSIGKFSVNVTAKDSLNVTYTKSMALNVLAGSATLPTVAPSGFAFDDCTVGVSCSRTVVVMNGGTAPFTWGAGSGLPVGMTIRTGSGVTSNNTTPGDAELWGTPSAPGLFNVQVTVTDANGATATNTFPLRVSVMTQTNGLNTGGPNPTLGVLFTRTLRVIGGTLPYTIAQTGGALPTGVTLNPGTFAVGGTPTESGNFSPQFTYTDADAGSRTVLATSFLNINGAGSGGVSINSGANLGSTTTGSFYSTTLNACCASGITWTVIGGALPTGVTLSAGGSLSGTASVSGVATFTVQATDNGNAANYAVRQFTLNVTPLSFSISSPLPYGNVGTLYTRALTATGGTGALTWTLPPGGNYLPPGLTLATDGTLSGTPTAKGQYSFNVTVTDTAAHSRTTLLFLSIYLNGEAPPVGQTQSANFGTRSIGQVELQLSATGGNGTYAWSVVGGALPPGLAIRTDLPSFFSGTASAGLIGVATTPGTYNFTLRVTSNSQTADQPSTLKITALTAKDPFSLPDAFVGTPYSYTFTALGNAGSVTWTPTGGVPAGLTLSPGGVLSGTPTTPTNNFNINFTLSDGIDSVGRGVNLTVSAISVAATGAPAPGVLPNATRGVAYSATVTAAGGAGGYTFTANGLPSGLSLNGATGVISGTPSSFGSLGKYSLNVTAKDSLNVSYSKTMALDVLAASATLPGVAPPGTGSGSGQSWDDCAVGVSCSRGVVVQNGGTAPFTWGPGSGLPAGMSIRTGSGVTSSGTAPGDAELWGTPTATGLFNVQLTVTDANGATATNTFPLRVSVMTQTNGLNTGGPNPTLGAPFTRTLRVLGGTLPYTIAQTGGTLPTGVTLNPGTFVVGGTPTESGNFSPQFTYTDADAGSRTVLATSFLNINGAGSGGVSIFSNGDLGSATTGFFYSNSLNACCSGSGITWTVIGGALPTGVTLSAGGSLSGTPSVSGPATFTAQATDNGNAANYAVRQFTLNVTPLSVNAGSQLPYGNVGTLYTRTLTATGGTGALTWVLAPANYLPPGLTLATDGTLSGTPTAQGQYLFFVTVSDTASHSRSTQLRISIYPPGAPFSDDPLTVGASIKAVHITGLRARIDALRTRFSLPAFTWTDPSLIVGTTIVKAVHLTELRTALAQAYSAAGQSTPFFSDPTITPGSTTVRVAHINELRNAVVALEGS